jgi:lipoprotein-releasing system permease protein
LYDFALIRGPKNRAGAQIKGISTEPGRYRPDLLTHLKQGSFDNMRTKDGVAGAILGSELAKDIGAVVGERVTVVNDSGNITPFGLEPRAEKVLVTGIFESGMTELDSGWVFMDVTEVQRLWDYPDVVNGIEMNINEIDDAREIAKAAEPLIGPTLKAVPWQEDETNRRLLDAFKVFRVATVVTIGLIQLVAALNILITLVMMVMEKHRDIAVLMSMGARGAQIRRIFIYKGALIGAVGTAIGLAVGYGVSYLANRYQWLQLDTKVFEFRYIPLESDPIDAIWIAALAMTVSLLATMYPARSATKIAPVESMRYE